MLSVQMKFTLKATKWLCFEVKGNRFHYIFKEMISFNQASVLISSILINGCEAPQNA